MKNKNIRGVEIVEIEHKISAYADGMLFFISQLQI